MASRRRRRKSIGKVIVDVESRLRRNEKRLAPKKIKRNSVSYAKIGYRSVSTSSLQTNSVTPNEAAFGTPVVSETEPTENLKDGTLWVNPADGSSAAYDYNNSEFVPITDAAAYTLASGKNTLYYSDTEPAGGTYSVDDTWFDTNDGYKMYTWNGSAWSGFQLGNSAVASISATKISAGSLSSDVILTSSISAGQISAGTISAAITMTSPTISTNDVTSASTVSSAAPRITIADQYLSFETSGVGIVIDSGAGYLPGGINVKSNLAGNASTLSIYGQAMTSTTAGIRGAITLNSGTTSSGGYAAIGVSNIDASVANTLLITSTYATLSAGSSTSVYGIRNIQCVTSFTPSTDTSGVNGDITLVYTA